MYPGLSEELVETMCTTLLRNIAVAFKNMFKNIKLWHKLQRLDQSSYLCHDSIFLVINKYSFVPLQIDKLAEAENHNV